jgi:hypothetical protein
MSNWNPLLIAIAFKRLDIVRYFLQDCALRHDGKKPGVDGHKSLDELAEQQIFSLTIAINNKDLKMFKELWGEYTCWEVIHL